jgi:hypothetical protein
MNMYAVEYKTYDTDSSPCKGTAGVVAESFEEAFTLFKLRSPTLEILNVSRENKTRVELSIDEAT